MQTDLNNISVCQHVKSQNTPKSEISCVLPSFSVHRIYFNPIQYGLLFESDFIICFVILTLLLSLPVVRTRKEARDHQFQRWRYKNFVCENSEKMD